MDEILGNLDMLYAKFNELNGVGMDGSDHFNMAGNDTKEYEVGGSLYW